jgi:hypothetical protein
LIGRGRVAQQRDHFFVIDKDCECGQSQVLVSIHNTDRANRFEKVTVQIVSMSSGSVSAVTKKKANASA